MLYTALLFCFVRERLSHQAQSQPLSTRELLLQAVHFLLLPALPMLAPLLQLREHCPVCVGGWVGVWVGVGGWVWVWVGVGVGVGVCVCV